ncbi:putative GMC oxidoreductase [Hypoxylon sp. NC0597]|nr:putative GMC oxidoreductase [Hypoxylon sp. NC0597]
MATITALTSDVGAEYDYVVVGGGTSGLVVASRLAEDKDVCVIVLEAGANPLEDPEIAIQGLAPAMYFDPDYDWCITTEPQVGLNKRRLAQPLGKTLGGSSAISLGMVRLGNPGWVWETMGSYPRKFHTFTEPQAKLKEFMLDYLNGAHGTDGAVQVSYGSEEDFPPFRSYHWRVQRSHAGNTYISNEVAQRSNLRVITEALVEKTLFTRQTSECNNVRATGVTFVGKYGQRRQVSAKRKVIQTAGAAKSPQLLELSGIGNNPNVGENFQDHGFVPFSWEAADPMTSGDQMRNPSVVEVAMSAYQEAKAGPLSVNPLASAFFPLQDQDMTPISMAKLLSDLHQEEVEPRVLREQICAPGDCSVQFILTPFQLNPFPGDNPSHIFGLGTEGFYVSIIAILSHPFSRGSIHIQSADPHSPPAVDPRAMTHTLDLELHARHVLLLEKIRDTSPLRELFKEDGRRLDNNGRRVETLDQAKEAVKNRCTPNYHVRGTAAMIPREAGGVVDSKLRVYGVDGLRIADASVFPLIPRGNIQSSVYAVAERAADIISAG